MRIRLKLPWLLNLSLGLVLAATTVGAVEMKPSFFEQEQQKLRYAFATASLSSSGSLILAATEEAKVDEFGLPLVKKKSPFKAFLLSMAIPGLGQYYAGSKKKAAIFFGADVALWGLHAKFHGDGEKATDDYEAFQLTHWSRDAYGKYILFRYDVTADSLTDAPEVSHTLPAENSQQFYEMTGKYPQFAWGWDDAVDSLDRGLDAYSQIDKPRKVKEEEDAPFSANRFTYNEMRHDANQKYDKAGNMLVGLIVNRLVSGFEALLATKNGNNRKASGGSTFGSVRVRPSMKSYYAASDTPFVNFAYKF